MNYKVGQKVRIKPHKEATKSLINYTDQMQSYANKTVTIKTLHNILGYRILSFEEIPYYWDHAWVEPISTMNFIEETYEVFGRIRENYFKAKRLHLSLYRPAIRH